MKTIAEQLNIKDFPFVIKDKQGNLLYEELYDGNWARREYDSEGNKIYYEDSCGFWSKTEYDSAGNEIYHENSRGEIQDNRPKDDTESTLRIREFFRQVRLKTHHHLGLGAIKLTLEDQEELCELVELLINKTIEQ